MFLNQNKQTLEPCMQNSMRQTYTYKRILNLLKMNNKNKDKEKNKI